jgi:hypothetical protein
MVYIDFQDGVGFREISNLVKFDTLEIRLRACADNWHYAQNEAFFDIIYDPIIYPLLCQASKETIIKIVGTGGARINTEELRSILTEDDLYIATEEGNIIPIFYGRVPPTKARSFNGIIDNTIFHCEALDELSLLKVKTGDICFRNYYIMNPADKAHSIVHQLAYIAGLSDYQIDNTISIMNVITALTPPSPDDLILDVLDTLLFEHGYTLNMSIAGQLSPIKWMRQGETYPDEFNVNNIVKSVSIEDALKTYDGSEVIYYELAEATTSSGDTNMLLYQDSNLPYDSRGNFEGFPVPAGLRYPPNAAVIDETTGGFQKVYQDYDDRAVKYWTNEAIVKKLNYNYKAFDSDYSAIIATSDWSLEYKTDSGITLVGTPVYENRRAEIVFLNNTVDSSKKIYYIFIYGKVLYKSTERKAIVNNTGAADAELDSYVSTYLFNKADADVLAKVMAEQHKSNDTYFVFESEQGEPVGQLVRIVFNDASVSDTVGVDAVGIITERYYVEETQLYKYRVKRYSTAALPALTSQEVHVIPNVQANMAASNSSQLTPVVVNEYAPKYMGRYNSAHPAVRNNGDWWMVYDTDDTPIQRGVWYDNNGVATRITTASSALLQAKFVEALTDVAWAEAQGIYGVSSNYGINTLFQSLGAVVAFFTSVFAQDITATGSITGSILRTSDKYAQLSNEAGDEAGYKGVLVSSTPINSTSPTGSIAQLVNLYNLFGARVPSLVFQSFLSGVVQLRAYITFNIATLVMKNAYSGLSWTLDGRTATLRKVATTYNSDTTSLLTADYISGNHSGNRLTNSFRSLHGSYQVGALYNQMSNDIPNVGDMILVTGGYYLGTLFLTVSRAERLSSTTIRLYVGFIGGVTAHDIAAADTTGAHFSLAW